MAKLLAADSSFNRIYEWVMNRDSNFISEKDKEIFDRLDFCDNQLRKFSKQKDVESMMRAKYPNISITQIKNDIACTKRLFSAISTFNKDYEKLFLLEDIKDTMIQARKKGDLNARTKAQKNYSQVLGLDKEDIDESKLENHQYVLTIATKETVLKINLLEIGQLPFTSKKRISDSLESDMSVDDAYLILNPELPEYDNEVIISE